MGALYKRKAVGLAQLPGSRPVDSKTQVLGDCEVMAVDEYQVHSARIVLATHPDGLVGDWMAGDWASMCLVVAAPPSATFRTGMRGGGIGSRDIMWNSY